MVSFVLSWVSSAHGLTRRGPPAGPRYHRSGMMRGLCGDCELYALKERGHDVPFWTCAGFLPSYPAAIAEATNTKRSQIVCFNDLVVLE